MFSLTCQKKCIYVVFIILVVVVLVSLLLFSSILDGEEATLQTFLKAAEKQGLKPAVSDELFQDESIVISINSYERGIHDSGSPFVRISYNVSNNANRKLLIISGGCCVECSVNGKKWYPFSNYHLEHIMDDGLMLYNMRWMISYSGGESDYLYLPEGDSLRSSVFVLDGTYPEELLSSEEIPDGYYRLIVRLCEYVDPDDIFHATATLVDYGYYFQPFQIKRGKLITDYKGKERF